MKKLLLLTTLLSLTFSCGGGSSDDGSISMPDPEPMPAPRAEAPDLLEPVNGEVCSKFSATNDASIVTVPFSWENSNNAAQYEIIVSGGGQNLSRKVSGTNTTFDITRNTEFEWTVTGINSDNVNGGKSETFSFHTPGIAQSNTVPYVVITFILDRANDSASLSWEGVDGDGENLSFDVVIKENNVIILELFDTEQTSVEVFTILDGALYEVNITVTDQQNNSSNTTEVKLNV